MARRNMGHSVMVDILEKGEIYFENWIFFFFFLLYWDFYEHQKHRYYFKIFCAQNLSYLQTEVSN